VQPVGESRLKKLGLSILFPIALIVILFLSLLLLRGMMWTFDKVYPWLLRASEIAFVICVLVFLPLCIFRKTRPWAGVGFVYASYVFGIFLFAYACFFVVEVWGYVGLAIGLIFAGVGVVPVALLAALLHAEWSVLLELTFGIFLTFGARFLGLRLTMIHPKEEEMMPDY
jgi:hypothetical protein